jgi:pimeloyl-ACP methyl ester carboxylesterase
MSKSGHFHASDLHAISRLAVTAVEGVIDLLEAFHGRVIGEPVSEATAGGIPGFAYRKMRASTAIVSRWCDELLARPAAAPGERMTSVEREAVVAALNGVMGDYLADSGNPLAIQMRLRHNGQALDLKKRALAAAIPEASGKLLILVHGLCRCDLHWRRGGHDHGAALARDLGYTPVYLHYNSGFHISSNGREFSGLMEELVKEWPVPIEEVAILAHSMGGLVARSACYYGKEEGHVWLQHLDKMIFLGTPHHGAPLERGGNWLTVVLGRSAYTAPFARLGRIRSAGITDLRYGNLVDEDWKGRDRFDHVGDCRRPVPLPRGVKCYTIAGTTGRREGDLRDRFLGDGLMPLDTALGRHEQQARTLSFPKSRQWVAYGTHHLDLIGRLAVYEKIREWLAQGSRKK